MGEPADNESAPKAERKTLGPEALSGRINALEKRINEMKTELQQAQAVITSQQLVVKQLMEERGEGVDSRSTMLIGALWNLAQDPFNSGAWDKFRKFLRAAQRA